MTRGLRRELLTLALQTVLALTVGVIIGYPISTLLVGGAIYLYFCYKKITALFTWINGESRYPPSELNGFWGEIAEAIYRDRRKLTKIQNRQEQELQRVQHIGSAMQDGIIILRDDATLDWWNPTAAKMLRIRQSDRYQPLMNRVRHPDFQAYFDRGQHDKPCTFSPTTNPNDTYEVHVNKVNTDKEELLVIFRDVSHVKRLEQMRKDFVGNISHELRTPLTVINGYIDTMETLLDMSKWGKIMSQIRNQSNRMTALTNDLTMLSKLEADNYSPRKETVDITALIQGIVEDTAHIASDNHMLSARLPDHDVLMQGDFQQLYSAISNLVVNAIRHNPEGCDVETLLESDDQAIIVQVKDTGKGIAQKHLPRLTERFYRTDTDRNSATGGTGLGLAIVKHVLQHHNGQLQIYSEEGQGSVFEIIFKK